MVTRNRTRTGYRGRLPAAMLGRQSSSAVPVTRGLLAHWDFGLAGNQRNATDGSGSPVTNGQEIKWTRDLSGRGKHINLATATGPTWVANTYNGRGCARFNANALGTTAANLGNGVSDISIFFLSAISSVASNGLMLAGGLTSYSVAGGAWFGMSGASGVYRLEASGSPIDYASSMPYDGRLRSFNFTYSNSGGALRVVRADGVDLGATAGTAYPIADGQFYIGGFATVNYFVGDALAVLVYDRVVTPTEAAAIELYMANLYGHNIPGTTWQGAYDPIQRASIRTATLNANMLGTSADPLKYDFDAEDVDELGTANASLTDQATIATWKNKGTAAGTGDATQGTDANRPALQKNLSIGMDAVLFGGNFDYLTIGSSAADLGFIHNANTHDIWVVGRKDLGSRQVLFSSTDLTSEKGFVLDFDTSGKLHYSRTNGTAAIKAVTLGTATPVGDLFVARAYAFSSSTGVAEYKSNQASAATNTNSVGAGDATNAAVIGSLASTAVGSLDGALFRILVFNVALDATSVAEIAAYLQSRYGV